MDGKKLTDTLGGEAIRLNPGSHDFTFETEGEKPVTKTIVLREGEAGRREAIAFGDVAAPSTSPSPVVSIVAGEGDAIRVDSEAVGVSRWSGPLSAGRHQVDITHDGKKPYSSSLELTANRSLAITLGKDKQNALPLWIWIAGGAVVASGMAIGGYFIFKGDDKTAAAPVMGGLDSGTLSLRFGR